MAAVESMLAEDSINIATLQLYRGKKGGDAVMVIEIDQCVPEASIRWFEQQDGIMKVTYIDREDA